jgi:hypothetical protein
MLASTDVVEDMVPNQLVEKVRPAVETAGKMRTNVLSV